MSYPYESSDIPEHVWKEVYNERLVDLEEDCFQQEFPIALIVDRMPGYSRWSGWCWLFCGALIFFALAYCLSSHSLNCGFWGGLFLNLGMGLVAGVVLYWFTERRIRILSGCEAVAKTMRKRLETLRDVMNEHLGNPHFVLTNRGDAELTFQWLCVHQNFISTMMSHLKYWDRLLKGKVDLDFGRVVSLADMKIREIGSRLENESSDLTYEELRLLSGDVWRLETGIVKSYEKRIELLEAKVLDVRYGCRSVSSWGKLCRKCQGGLVTEQIKLDMALEKMKCTKSRISFVYRC